MPKKRKACPSSFDKASVKVGRPSKDGCTIEDAVKLVSSSFNRSFSHYHGESSFDAVSISEGLII
jgi:hypothetical protein